MRTLEIVIVAAVVLFFLIGLYIYPVMPESVASHWDAQGQVNGHMPKFWGVFFVPLLAVFLAALFLAIPRIDPMKKNIEEFRGNYEKFILLLFVFFLYVYLLTIAWNLGHSFDMTALLAPGFAVLFFYSGVLIEHAKMNWFIGIRTPWTMSSEAVWDRTHKLGGKLFKLCGILSLIGAVFGPYAIAFVLAPVILASAYLVLYSYLEFQKEEKGKKNEKPKRTRAKN